MPSQQEIADQLQFLQTSRAKLGIYLGQLRLQGQAFVQPSVLLGIAEERGCAPRESNSSPSRAAPSPGGIS